MRSFFLDLDKIAFLLEVDAALWSGDLTAHAAAEDRPAYRTNYIGSKQKLIEWIWKHTPSGVESVADAFSGSGVVSYMFKSKGLKVSSNDRLRFAYHTARAIVENSATKLEAADLDKLCADNPKAGTFVREHFKDVFYSDEVNGAIDNVRANIDSLTGYKRDLALAALGRACLSAKAGFGHFTAVSGERSGTKDDFHKDFRDAADRLSGLVFDNGKECQASRRDVVEFLPTVDADLGYFDPPYATEFSTTNYEKAYHFVEGLMTYWECLTMDAGSKVKAYQVDHKTVTKGNASGFFDQFLRSANHIPHWLISYRDHSYPNEEAMQNIIKGIGRSCRMESHEHKYSITSKRGDASTAMERLFICAQEKTKADAALHANASLVETARDGARVVIEIKIL